MKLKEALEAKLRRALTPSNEQHIYALQKASKARAAARRQNPKPRNTGN
jgi:hypothetical protein